MKKYVYLILSLLLIPITVNGETLTYNVCESGCEYTDLFEVEEAINNISDLSDKDIVINVNSNLYSFIGVGNIHKSVKSVTINGNNHDFNGSKSGLSAKRVVINGCNNINDIQFLNAEKVSINNSSIKIIVSFNLDSNGQNKSDEISLSNVLDIDETSRNNLKVLALVGNYKIENMDFSNQMLYFEGGTINIHSSKLKKLLNKSGSGKLETNIYDSEIESIFNYSYSYDIDVNIYESKLGKIINAPEQNLITNIYNSKFNSLKYVNIISEQNETMNEVIEFFNSYNNSQFIPDYNTSMLNYDIYDLDGTSLGLQSKSTTTVYFDKEAKLKPGNKLNLVNYLDYYTEDKEIEYTIDDESIAKIENKELIGLKEGSTKVTVTTDEGHVVYRINLTIEKETIPEKIDKMTIKVPITGSKLKLWVLIVGGILLGIALICVYMLIKRKK